MTEHQINAWLASLRTHLGFDPAEVVRVGIQNGWIRMPMPRPTIEPPNDQFRSVIDVLEGLK